MMYECLAGWRWFLARAYRATVEKERETKIAPFAGSIWGVTLVIVSEVMA